MTAVRVTGSLLIRVSRCSLASFIPVGSYLAFHFFSHFCTFRKAHTTDLDRKRVQPPVTCSSTVSVYFSQEMKSLKVVIKTSVLAPAAVLSEFRFVLLCHNSL